MSNLYATCFLYLFLAITYFNILDLKDVKTRYNFHKSITINTKFYFNSYVYNI